MKNYITLIVLLILFLTIHNLVVVNMLIEKPTARPTVKPTATPTVSPTVTPTVSPTATPIKPMFVVSTNKGFWKFFLNWYYHATKALTENELLDRLIVVPKDNDSHEMAVKMGIRHLYSPLRKQSHSTVNYETKDYKKMVSQRPRILSNILDIFNGTDIIYLDVDTVMLKDITELVDYNVDFMSGIEVTNYNGHPQYYCTGIMFIKNSWNSRMVLRRWMEEMEETNNVNQPSFNKILYSHKNVSFSGFPQHKVMSGDAVKRKYKQKGSVDKDVYLVHANYLQGYVAKAQFLHKYGLWKSTGNLVVSICTASRSDRGWVTAEDSYLWTVLMKSIKKVTNRDQFYKYDLKLYVAVDDDDKFWKVHLSELQQLWDAKSPHPLTVVPKIIPKTDSIPWNDITLAAYHDGSDYFVRVNDDSEFVTMNWTDIIVDELVRMDNFGVVGPKSLEGNTDILVHDAVHKSHIELFGFYYPPFKNWYIDNWMTYVYRHRTKILNKLRIKHHIYKTRYKIHTPERGVYEKILKDTSRIAAAHPIEKRVAIITNGFKCAMNDKAFYYDTDVEKAAYEVFPTWFIVCHNDTFISSGDIGRDFVFPMLGSKSYSNYHVTHMTDYMLYGPEAVVGGTNFKRKKQDRAYSSNLVRK